MRGLLFHPMYLLKTSKFICMYIFVSHIFMSRTKPFLSDDLLATSLSKTLSCLSVKDI